jgi:hypothetical protein
MTTPPNSSGASTNQPSREPGQRIEVTSGNHSPVNVNAPFSYAEQGGTAHTNADPSSPAPTPWWSRASVVWSAVGALATVAGVIVAILAFK